jgi:hypothetical protein
LRTSGAPSTGLLIGNFLAFQFAWFACVMAAAGGQPWLGIATIAAVAAVFIALSPRPARTLLLYALVTLAGAAWDSLTSATGWIHFIGAAHAGWLLPLWMISMWTLFATMLNVCLRWLRGRTWLAALCGLVGGPLAYFGGARLGAVSFGNLPAAMLLQGAGWALLTPALIGLGARLER